MREQTMVLVRTIARDAPGLGREKGTIVQDEGQGNHGNEVLGTCDVGLGRSANASEASVSATSAKQPTGDRVHPTAACFAI